MHCDWLGDRHFQSRQLLQAVPMQACCWAAGGFGHSVCNRLHVAVSLTLLLLLLHPHSASAALQVWCRE